MERQMAADLPVNDTGGGSTGGDGAFAPPTMEGELGGSGKRNESQCEIPAVAASGQDKLNAIQILDDDGQSVVAAHKGSAGSAKAHQGATAVPAAAVLGDPPKEKRKRESRRRKPPPEPKVVIPAPRPLMQV